jgi:hypothetical protein
MRACRRSSTGVRGGSLRLPIALLALTALQLSAAPLATADDHLMRIREVSVGASTGAPNLRFVELQMTQAGQNKVVGNHVHVYNAAGSIIGTYTFPANVTNSLDQTSILIGTSQTGTFYGVTPDLTMPSPALQRSGGMVCYDDIDANGVAFPAGARDCVSWGNFTGSPPSATGTPFRQSGGIVDGMSMVRDISASDPARLQPADDTNNSAADFDTAFPVPRNNASTTTTTGGSALVDGSSTLDYDAVSTGAGVKNNVTVAPSGAFWRLTDLAAPVAAGSGCEQLTVNRVRCAQAGVTSASLNGSSLADRMTAANGLDTTLLGGAGDDMLTGMDAADTLNGEAGSDTMDGGAGPDTFNGGTERDVVLYSRRTAGQPVTVDIDGAAGDDGGAIDEDTGVFDSLMSDVENVKGGAGDDSITGNASANVLFGNGGVDELFGLGANDELRVNGDGLADTANCGAGGSDHVFRDLADIFSSPPDPDACEIVH